MKILMVLENDFPPDVRVEKEALSLQNKGHEVAIVSICFTKDARESNYKQIRLFKKYISFLVYKSGALALSIPLYFNFWKKYVRDIRNEFEFDAIHVHDLPLASVGLYAKKKFGVHYILDLHENYPALVDASPYSKTFLGKLLISVRQWRNYERKMVPRADRVITVIREMAERIKSVGVQREKIEIVSNLPMLSEMIHVKGTPDNEYITLFYSGGINYHRGLQDIIRALPEMISIAENTRLWIVGTGSYLDRLTTLVAQLDIQDHVKFWGWKPFGEMVQIQAKADIALIPHLRTEQSDNSSPNKLYEYMFYEKPVLASDCISVARILSETEAGVVYTSGSIDSCVKEFKKLLDQQYRRQLAANGLKAVRKNLNWEVSSETIGNIYNNL